MINTFETVFEIGDYVYHIIPEGDKGVIIDISYSKRSKMVKYNVVYGRGVGDDIWCCEEELSTNKTF